MGHLVLYSTNVFLKQLIQKTYRHDVHYVWCSNEWDSASVGRYSPNALTPPSSNPADIYRDLVRDIRAGDMHSPKIREQKAVFIKLAEDWHSAGEITDLARDELLYLVNNAPLQPHWRPLVYVIPRDRVAGRLNPVPPNRRAGIGEEYIITDLRRDEFELIEL